MEGKVSFRVDSNLLEAFQKVSRGKPARLLRHLMRQAVLAETQNNNSVSEGG